MHAQSTAIVVNRTNKSIRNRPTNCPQPTDQLTNQLRATQTIHKTHSDCFVRKSWWGPHTLATGVMLDRMILMPLCWLAILVFNAWTVVYLRGETGRFMALTSVKRLQLRLVLITAAFIVIWGLMSIPLYANNRTFALEFGVKVGRQPAFQTPRKQDAHMCSTIVTNTLR